MKVGDGGEPVMDLGKKNVAEESVPVVEGKDLVREAAPMVGEGSGVVGVAMSSQRLAAMF